MDGRLSLDANKFLFAHVGPDGTTHVSMVRRPRTLSSLGEAPNLPVARQDPPRLLSATPGLTLPAQLTRDFKSTPLPGGGPMGDAAGVPMLTLGSSLNLSASLPELRPPSLSSTRSSMGSTRRVGSVSALALGGITGASEWRLRRRQRREDAERFARRHIENWRKLEPWLLEKEAARLTQSTRLLRKIQAAAKQNKDSTTKTRTFWQEEFEKPGYVPPVTPDPASIEPRRGGRRESAPMSLRVPTAPALDGGVHNPEWGGSTTESIRVGWVDPYLGGAKSGAQITKYQLQYRPAGSLAACAATFAAAASSEEMGRAATTFTTAVATAAAVEVTRALAQAQDEGSGRRRRGSGGSNGAAQAAALRALRHAAEATEIYRELLRLAIDAEEGDQTDKQGGEQQEKLVSEVYARSLASTATGGRRVLSAAAARAAALGVGAHPNWDFPDLSGRQNDSAAQRDCGPGIDLLSRSPGGESWKLAELDPADVPDCKWEIDLPGRGSPASAGPAGQWLECRLRAATMHGFGEWSEPVMLQSSPAAPALPPRPTASIACRSTKDEEGSPAVRLEWLLLSPKYDGGAPLIAVEVQLALLQEVTITSNPDGAAGTTCTQEEYDLALNAAAEVVLEPSLGPNAAKTAEGDVEDTQVTVEWDLDGFLGGDMGVSVTLNASVPAFARQHRHMLEQQQQQQQQQQQDEDVSAAAADSSKGQLRGHCIVTELLPGALYSARLRSVNAHGSSDWSAWSRFTTLASKPSSRSPSPLPALTPSSPNSPGNFVRDFNSLPDVPSWLGDPMFGDATQTAVTLRWRRPPPPLEGLESTEGLRLRATELRWRPVVAGTAKDGHTVAEEDGEWSQLELPAESGALGALDVDAWTVSPLEPGTDYEFGVRLRNGHGFGGWAAQKGRTRRLDGDDEDDDEGKSPLPAMSSSGLGM